MFAHKVAQRVIQRRFKCTEVPELRNSTPSTGPSTDPSTGINIGSVASVVAIIGGVVGTVGMIDNVEKKLGDISETLKTRKWF
ncbi:hypothetical protein RCL_jg10379.t1 [Rhizophagus clarus]|uniref:Uncharacterized protein n=1 Tax=Rhizophagus clarus TaxID=94130 RepID=A0A8H3KS29_9GLOM|nr:hypothetical protein RCL_jg10379.t1 [Rhizophagus clarus]